MFTLLVQLVGPNRKYISTFIFHYRSGLKLIVLIGLLAGVIYSRLYTQQHNTGFREDNLTSMPLKVGTVPLHMITFSLCDSNIYSDLSLRRSISFDVHDSSFYFIVLSYCVSLRSEFRYDFRIKTIQGSS